MFFERPDGPFGHIYSMVVWGDQLDFHRIVMNVLFNGLQTLVIHHVQRRLILSCTQDVEDVGECGDEGGICSRGHGTDDDGVEVINICNENVLHVFECSDRECAGEVRVHCTGVGIGKCSETKHVLNSTRLVRGDTINLCPCKKFVGMIVACRSSVGAMTSHVAFVGGS